MILRIIFCALHDTLFISQWENKNEISYENFMCFFMIFSFSFHELLNSIIDNNAYMFPNSFFSKNHVAFI